MKLELTLKSTTAVIDGLSQAVFGSDKLVVDVPLNIGGVTAVLAERVLAGKGGEVQIKAEFTPTSAHETISWSDNVPFLPHDGAPIVFTQVIPEWLGSALVSELPEGVTFIADAVFAA